MVANHIVGSLNSNNVEGKDVTLIMVKTKSDTIAYIVGDRFKIPVKQQLHNNSQKITEYVIDERVKGGVD